VSATLIVAKCLGN